MKGTASWNYRPYKPYLYPYGDLCICRIAPGKNAVHFEWLSEPGEVYTVFWKKRDEEAFAAAGTTSGNEWDLTGLADETDYAFYIASGAKKSRVRLARTGETIGTVVNYLHPEDEIYSFSGRYLCSPSLVRHPDGFLLASMDLFAGDHPQNLTLIFRSDDEGETWHYVTDLMPCFWGKMFIHRGELYMLACSTEYGDLLIGRSTDGGRTFSQPSVLLRGSNGKWGNTGVHKNPQNVMHFGGRIYETLEWGSWQNTEYYHAAMVMSCDENADLLDPASWHFSEPLKYDPQWPGTVNGEAKGTIEGTLVSAPDGSLLNIMRYNIVSGDPPYGLVLAYRVNTEDPDAPLEYSHSIRFPCNNSKFTMKYDSVSGRYYSIGTRIDCAEHAGARFLLSLLSSKDLETWDVVCDLHDYRHASMEKVGFQYVDFEMEGDDMIYLCRTALNDAHNYHDANYSTFHRIRNFRDL